MRVTRLSLKTRDGQVDYVVLKPNFVLVRKPDTSKTVFPHSALAEIVVKHTEKRMVIIEVQIHKQSMEAGFRGRAYIAQAVTCLFIAIEDSSPAQ